MSLVPTDEVLTEEQMRDLLGYATRIETDHGDYVRDDVYNDNNWRFHKYIDGTR